MPNIIYKRNADVVTDTKILLQRKCLVGWSGDSKDSDIGSIKGLNVAGVVQSTIKKVGSNSFSYSGGDNSAIEFRLNESLKGLKLYSISCWCRWNNFNYAGPWGMWGGVVANWDQRPGIHASCGNTGSSPSKLNILLWDGITGNPGGTSTRTTTNLSINTWYHCIFEINNTFLKIYLNGILEGTSRTFSSSLDLWSTAQVFRLAGYELNSPVVQLNGYIDEFYILDGALSQEEIDWLYNSGNGNSLL